MADTPHQPLDIELAEEVMAQLPEDVALFCVTFRKVDEAGQAFDKEAADTRVRVACNKVYRLVATKVAERNNYDKAVLFVRTSPVLKRTHVEYDCGQFPYKDLTKVRILNITAAAVLNRIEQLYAETTTSV